MSSLHVARIVALMAQKNPALTAEYAEIFLEGRAIPLAPDCWEVMTPYGYTEEFCWGADATGAGLLQVDAALALP